MQTKKLLITAFVILVISFFFYAITTPNINTGYADSDELITVAKIWGVAHPPAYPLYTLMAGVFGRLPLPLTFAGRINLLSALLHSITLALLFLLTYMLITKLRESRLTYVASLIGTSVIAVCISFWFHGLFAEVFPLHLVLAISYFLCLTLYDRRNDYRCLIASAFLFGLGIGNQQTFVLLIPAIIWFLFSKWSQILLNFKLVAILLAVCIAGFALPYLYVPIAANNHTVINWEIATNGTQLMRVITRRFYSEQGDKAYVGGSVTPSRIVAGSGVYLDFILKNLGIIFSVVFAVGIIYLLSHRSWRLLGFINLPIMSGGWFFSIYAYNPVNTLTDMSAYPAAGVFERFLLITLPFFGIIVSFGILALFEIIQKRNQLSGAIFIFIMVIIVAFFGIENFQKIKSTDFGIGHQFARSLLQSLDKDAVLLCTGEQSCFTPLELQYVEGIRRDVKIISTDFSFLPIDEVRKRYPGLVKTIRPANSPSSSVLFLRDLISWNIDKYPIYYALFNYNPDYLSAMGIYQNPFFVVPQGCTMRITKSFHLLSYPKPCRTLNQIAVTSQQLPQAKITYMFPAYLSFQHVVNGLIYELHDCNEKARDEYRQSLAIAPNFGLARDTLAKMSKKTTNTCAVYTQGQDDTMLQKQLAQGIEQKDLMKSLLTALELQARHPDDLETRKALITIYLLGNNQQFALYEAQDLYKLDPKNQFARQILLKLDPK